MAFEQRLLAHSKETGVGLDRLRRRVLFERIVARLHAAEPGRWVLKGGMALEVRLRDDARRTKDVDLGLRDEVSDSAALHERLVDALSVDPDGDAFMLTVAPPTPLREDGEGHSTWRVKLAAGLADKPFGRVQLDISPRSHELDATDHMALPNSLDFAGIPAPVVEIVDAIATPLKKLPCHASGLRRPREFQRSRPRRPRPPGRPRPAQPATIAASSRQVWAERDGLEPPAVLPPLPGSWPGRYE